VEAPDGAVGATGVPVAVAARRDPRRRAKVLFPLPEMLLLARYASIAGEDAFVGIGRWGTGHPHFLRRFLPFQRGIPQP
jgi:hypothetical protein